MELVDLTLPTPEENLALDEALLGLSEASADGAPAREFLRFWESPVPFVVLGVSSRIRLDVDVEACMRDRVPILRRASGGGTVLQGPGCLSFAVVVSLRVRPELEDLRRSYRWVLDRVASALGTGEIEIAGTSDLAIGTRKISGNAQKRTRHVLLHHGTILHRFDLASVERWLRHPPKAPAYREGRAHADFVENLNLDATEIRRRLTQAFEATSGRFDPPLLEGFLRDKYADPAWTWRF